jgi:hypothetical protein
LPLSAARNIYERPSSSPEPKPDSGNKVSGPDSLTMALGIIIGLLVVVIVILAYFAIDMASTNSTALAAIQSLREQNFAETKNNRDSLLDEMQNTKDDLNLMRNDLDSLRTEVNEKMDLQNTRTNHEVIELRDIKVENAPRNPDATTVVSLQ